MFPARRVTIHGKEFTLKRQSTLSARASVEVKGNTIIVKIPRRCQREKGFRIFLELSRKFIRNLERHPEKIGPVPLRFRNRQEVSVMGKNFRISVQNGNAKSSSAGLEGETIDIRLAKGMTGEKRREHVSNLVRRVISTSVHSVVHKKVNELNRKHFRFRLNKVFLKGHTSQWGSCSGKRNLNLNFRLLFAPPEIMDYVVVHELAHLKEKNHSPAFWKLVGDAVPDYKEKKKWLRENGNKLGPSFKMPAAKTQRT